MGGTAHAVAPGPDGRSPFAGDAGETCSRFGRRLAGLHGVCAAMRQFATRRTRAWVLAGATALAAVSAAGSSLDATFANIDRAAARLTAVTADLHYVAYTAVIQAEDRQTGKFLLKRTKAHAMDAHKGEIYLPAAQTVQQYDLGKYKSMINEFLLVGFGSTSKELRSGYSIALGGTDTIGSAMTTRLELTPRSPEKLMDVKRIDLWISDASGIVVQQKFYSGGGDYKVATYSNLVVNPNLADSAVRLNLPKGVKREYPQK